MLLSASFPFLTGLKVMEYSLFSTLSLFIYHFLVILMAVFCVYLVVRASIAPKGFAYYRGHLRYFPGFLILSFLFLSLMWLIYIGCYYLASLFVFYFTGTIIIFSIPFLFLMPSYIFPFYLSPIIFFTILFYLDSNGSIVQVFKSLVHGFKMAIYNYPFCILNFIILLLGTLIGNLIIFFIDLYLIQFLGFYMGYITTLFKLIPWCLPIPLCFFTNFYTKRIHDQFDLYYPSVIKE
jgi:hypothetical protein